MQAFYKNHKLAISVVIALGLGLIVVWLGYILDQRSTTESVAIQVVQVILTSFAVVIPTRILAQRQEAEINKNRAKMALKRTITLYNQMNKVAQYIESQREFIKNESKNGLVRHSLVENSLDTISSMHTLQYGVIEDISSDWHDVIPEEFNKLERVQGQQSEEEKDG